MIVTEQYIVDTIMQGQVYAFTFGADIIEKEKLGESCECKKDKLAFLIGAIKRLMCYYPIGSTLPSGVTATVVDPCYTAEEGKKLIEVINKLTRTFN